MTLDRRHIMMSNLRLINQIERDLFDDAEKAWVKVYSDYCKQHGQLNPERVMQFKYKGTHFHMDDDVPLRGGVRPLHPELEPEFKEAYKMFVLDVNEEKRVLKNMLADAIRIAKYTEDLLDILPPIMHDSIREAGFFQADDKPMMSTEQAEIFKATHSKYFDMFDLRKTVGAIM